MKALPRFRRDFRRTIELKLVRRATPDGNAKKNLQKTLPATSLDGLFRSRAHFGSILGFRPDPHNRQKSSLCLLREPPVQPVYTLREALGSLDMPVNDFTLILEAPGASQERFWMLQVLPGSDCRVSFRCAPGPPQSPASHLNAPRSLPMPPRHLFVLPRES